MLANDFSMSTCFAIFELIKLMCFGSTLSYPHKEFLKPRPPRTRTQSRAGSRTRRANVSTRNPHGLTRPAQDSTRYTTDARSCKIAAWVPAQASGDGCRRPLVTLPKEVQKVSMNKTERNWK